MIENSVKEAKVIDNTQWKERHQFVLSANGNIICQRYFKVNGFNPNSLHSVELLDTVRDIVDMIKADLVSKSRVYTGITMTKRSKLTGFYEGEELSYSDRGLICSDKYEGEIELSNGVVLNKTYIENDMTEDVDDEPFEFKFSYLFDDKLVCEEIWDGTVYPKYIRNSVDLSNSNSSYKYTDPMRMTFSQQMTKHLNEGRIDLIYTIIRMFCDTLSNNVDEDGNSTEKEYTSEMEYGDKTYYCTAYPREYVKGWANAVRQKTIKYKRWVEWDLPQSKLDYINKHM
jgi:hypothetical protein